MHRPHRRRLLRSALAFALLVGVVVAISQLAGVAERREAGQPTVLEFDTPHETWMVQAPADAARELPAATAKLGGGKTGGELSGDWHEVRLGSEVTAAEAEAAFGAAGATNVEPVLPRVPYDEPTATDDAVPASDGAAPSTEAPSSHEDGAVATGVATQLRNGPVSAARIGEQWALAQPSDQDIDAPEAWQVGTGAGAVVAVIDTGVDASHPDLAGRVLPGRDFSGSATGATVDKVGHGTAVASIIAANGTAMAGVAPDAKILPLKVFRDSASAFSMSGYVQAIRYAADQGVDAINISLGCGGSTSCYSKAELDALDYASTKGVEIVVAAGNGDANGNGLDNDSPKTPDFPSGYELPGLIAVTSSTRAGDRSTWANYGASTVDLAAPGEGILVAAPLGSYRSVTGTSFSAPMVSGAVALVAAANPGIGVDDLKSRILQSAVASRTLAGRVVSGGILNANGALYAVGAANVSGGGAATTVTKPTPTAPRSRASIGTPPTLAWTLPAGWRSARVLLSGPGGRFDQTVSASSRAVSQPARAWRSGTYEWRVQARTPAGTLVTSATSYYTLLPRLGAWVMSGRVRTGGRSVRLRVGYAASVPQATVQVRITHGSSVLHSGRAERRTMHVRGTGSPRRGWFEYDAKLARSLRRGERIVVEVRVVAGGQTLVRRFGATAR